MLAATLFSGIGAPECARPEWDWRWHAEIEKFPAAVLAARHPQSINLGDVNAEDFVARAERAGRPDVLVFGSPCQDFSVAGQRVGLDGDRGNLALVALGIARRLRPRWVVFENVPGLLSSYSGSAEAERSLRDRVERGQAEPGEFADADEDSDFAAFLSLVQQCGYFGCYRITDAQFAGVPQRRRRVFAVFHLGDWRPAAAVLFEPESLRGDYPPSRAAWEGIAPTISARTKGGGGLGTDFDCDGGLIAGAVSSKWSKGTGGPAGDECYNLVAEPIPVLEAGARTGKSTDDIRAGMGVGESGDPMFTLQSGKQHAVAIPEPIGFNARQDPDAWVGRTGPLDTDGCTQAVAIPFDTTQVTSQLNYSNPQPNDPCHPLASGAHPPAIAFTAKDYGADAQNDLSPTLRAGGHTKSHANAGVMPAIAFQSRIARNGRGQPEEVVPALNGADAGTTSDMRPMLAVGATVRRLTPRECERLQNFPDDWTLIQYRGKRAADGPRYKALGNAMNVAEIRWVLQRVELVDNLLQGDCDNPARRGSVVVPQGQEAQQ